MLGQSKGTRFGRSGLLIALGLLMTGGCTMPTVEDVQFATRHQPEVQLVQVRHTVRFPDGNGRLDAIEREQLDDFLSNTDPGDGDAVFVAAAQGDPKLAERRGQTVAAYLDMRDVDAQIVSSDAVAQPPSGDAVDVIVNRYLVTLPGCPDWTGGSRLDWTNAPTSNFGCANATNLGMMVANPRDLEVGRDAGPMDGEFAVLGIQRYRAGETKELKVIEVTIEQTGGDD